MSRLPPPPSLLPAEVVPSIPRPPQSSFSHNSGGTTTASPCCSHHVLAGCLPLTRAGRTTSISYQVLQDILVNNVYGVWLQLFTRCLPTATMTNVSPLLLTAGRLASSVYVL